MEDSESKEDNYNKKKSKDQMKLQSQSDKDEERNYDFFKSLRKYSKFTNFVAMFSLAVIAISAVSGGLYLRSRDEDLGDVSVSEEAAKCLDTQVLVLDKDGYECQDCEPGEYGSWDVCEEETGDDCVKNHQSTCYKSANSQQ